MKKIISILLTFVLLLSVIIVPVYAENDVQKIFGQLTSIGSHSYTISDENGTALITAEAVADGITLQFGVYAWFTIETLTDEEGDYQCITGYEILPEADEEVGYLCSVSSYSERISIYTDKLNEFDICDNVTVNGEDMEKNVALTKLQNQKVAVSFKTNKNNYIRKITFIAEPKTSIKDQKYNTEKQTFDGLEYPITENTNILYMIKNENKFTGFDSEYTYSFDVASYDKDKNARLIIITDMYKSGMEFFTAYNDDYCYTRDEKGNINRRDCDDRSLLDNISPNSMIEFTYNENNVIKSAKVVKSTDFKGYTYDKDNNTFGGYSLDNISLLTVEFNERTGNVKTYEPITPNENLQYSGQMYTSSFGKNVLWITDSAPIAGKPTIKFWAQDNRDDTFRVSATYDKNGYTGGGMIYLAVYYQGRLYRIYTYNLEDEGSAYIKEWDELDPVIFERAIPYIDGTDKYDYTIIGFVWNDNLSPMYPAVPVWD